MNIRSVVGYVETDIESVIIQYPKSQPRQIHNQKNDRFFTVNLSISDREKGKNRSCKRQQKPT
ncbi:hypothetical protein NK356_22240 [Chryseobacterium sp. S0630]|uniref:hypothetical protein n=1 Tax=unclassified Chryseobacterium TaxID=2593645 RepID=UPI0012E09537|nr:hypothetical protein [Chryseobacterium sp. S0630]MCP1301899.1 hypothetical protein [Chryseobacterium sp. S0630]